MAMTPSRSAVDPRYGPIWTVAACVAVAAWSVDAVAQSPRAPLALLVTGLGLLGGLVLAVAPLPAQPRGRRFLTGVVCAVGCVLVTVGVGHHLGAGLLTVLLVAATSPPAIPWLARRLSR